MPLLVPETIKMRNVCPLVRFARLSFDRTRVRIQAPSEAPSVAGAQDYRSPSLA